MSRASTRTVEEFRELRRKGVKQCGLCENPAPTHKIANVRLCEKHHAIVGDIRDDARAREQRDIAPARR